MIEPDYPEPSPEQALLLSRVRRMMLIAGATTGLAIAAILVAIGYRLYTSEGSGAIRDVTATLPRGARISATAVAGDQLVLMLDVGGMTEIRTFDAKTLRPSGKLTFTNEPGRAGGRSGQPPCGKRISRLFPDCRLAPIV